MNGSICMLRPFFESFWNWTKTQITRRCCSFALWKKGERSNKQTTTLCLQIVMILTFPWVRTFQWERCVCVRLLSLGAVFIFFDNKVGNYSVMIKIYSTTRRMCACIYIGCVCTSGAFEMVTGEIVYRMEKQLRMKRRRIKWSATHISSSSCCCYLLHVSLPLPTREKYHAVKWIGSIFSLT